MKRRKMHYYGKDVESGKIYRFSSWEALHEWRMSLMPKSKALWLRATSPEVRRALRRMAADPALTFPLEID